ncbi:MAG: TIM44-like domain-containing protein [Nitrospirae bacterium]|nr:TIM44-like domain-containing protein [Nitrospirota bacterium]
MKKALILLLIAVLSLLSCGKEVKKVTDESKTAQEAIALAEEIKKAYLKEDLAVIEKNTTKEGYREFLGAIKKFDKAELTFSSKWVEIEKTSVSMKIAWSGTWIVGERAAEERGTALFIFEGSPLKLSRILRANPFRQPE